MKFRIYILQVIIVMIGCSSCYSSSQNQTSLTTSTSPHLPISTISQTSSSNPEPSITPDLQGIEIISLNDEWNRYVNHHLGFSMDIPKMMYRYPAECVWEQTGEQPSFKLEGGVIPVVVIEDEDRVYITSKTIIEVSSSRHDPEGKVQYPNDICEKKENSLEMLRERDYSSFIWEIAFKNIETDEDLENLVDSYYGECFSVGEINPVENKDYSQVHVLGDQKPVEESNCLLRGMYIFLYSQDLKIAATWKTGQMVHFSATGFNEGPYDGIMSDSFQFIPRMQEE